MLVVACLMRFIHFMTILAHGYFLLSCYGLFVRIHSYCASLGMVVDIIAQIHACMPCEAP
jgi:hypothetical protein